jgi:hypothetical protein
MRSALVEYMLICRRMALLSDAEMSEHSVEFQGEMVQDYGCTQYSYYPEFLLGARKRIAPLSCTIRAELE